MEEMEHQEHKKLEELLLQRQRQNQLKKVYVPV
jgi:hypothetical protein